MCGISGSENMEICSKCGTSADEILKTGFVGCEKCYDLPSVRAAVEKMFEGKKHRENFGAPAGKN